MPTGVRVLAIAHRLILSPLFLVGECHGNWPLDLPRIDALGLSWYTAVSGLRDPLEGPGEEGTPWVG